MAIALVDDPGQIPDGTVLYRRVDWNKVGGRPSEPGTICRDLTPNFFTDAPPAVAARFDLERVCMSVGTSLYLGDHPGRMVENLPGMGVVSFLAGAVRNLVDGTGQPIPQGVMLLPTREEPWHAVVFDLSKPKRSGGACKAIARVAHWAIPLVS